MLAPLLALPSVFPPGSLLTHAGRDAWLAAAAGALAAILVTGGFFYLERRIRLGEEKPNPPDRLAFLALGIYLLPSAVLIVSQYARMMGMIIPESPPSLYVFGLVFLAAAGNVAGLEVLARLAGIFVPVTIVLFLLTLAGNYPNLEPARLEPFLLHGAGRLWEPAVTVFLAFGQAMGGLALLPALGGDRSHTPLWPPVVAGAVLVLMLVEIIATFGPTEARELAFPSFEVAKMVKLDLFLENLESLVASFGIMVFFQALSSLMAMAGAAFGQALGRADRRGIDVGLALLVLGLALYFSANPFRLKTLCDSEVVTRWPGYALLVVMGMRGLGHLWPRRS